jgi:hypothetical protein
MERGLKMSPFKKMAGNRRRWRKGYYDKYHRWHKGYWENY